MSDGVTRGAALQVTGSAAGGSLLELYRRRARREPYTSPTFGSLDGRLRGSSPTLRRMRQPFKFREQWLDVSREELEAFLRDYPRQLDARPPLGRKANYREWLDPALGAWPDSAIAKAWKRGASSGWQIRQPIPTQER